MVEVASATAIATVQAQVRQQAAEQFEQRQEVSRNVKIIAENKAQERQNTQNIQTQQAVKPTVSPLLSQETLADKIFQIDQSSPKALAAERRENDAAFKNENDTSEALEELAQSRIEIAQRQVVAAESLVQESAVKGAALVSEIIAAIPKAEAVAQESLENSQKIIKETEAVIFENELSGARESERIKANEAFSAALSLASDNASNEPAGADIIEAATEVFQGVDVSA